MTIFIDTTNGVIVRDKTFTVPLQNLTFKRGDIAAVTIKFLVDREIQTPSASREIRFGVKAAGSYDSDFLVYADTYSIAGDGYLLEVNFNTEALNALFNIDEDSENDVETVTLMGEVAWSDITDYWNSSNTIPVIVNNDVIRGTEGTPLLSKSLTEWFNDEFADQLASTRPLTASETSVELPDIVPTQGTSIIGFDNLIESGDTITIGLSTYFFTEILAAENDVLIEPGATATETASRFLSAINATDASNPYNTVANSFAYAISGNDPGEVVITSRSYGSVNTVVSGDFVASSTYITEAYLDGTDGFAAALGQNTIVYADEVEGLQVIGIGEPLSLWICTRSVPAINFYEHKQIADFTI